MTWALRVVLLVVVAARVAPAQIVTSTNPHGPNIGACAACHSPDRWRPALISPQFVHAPGKFALEGAHQRTACTACHTSLDFAKAPTGCAQCHRDVHNAELGADCAQCHTTRSFVDQTNLKRMHELTRFPLRGAHVTVACESCHPAAQPGQSQYRRRPTACIGCHSANYRNTKSPDHQAAGFSQECTQCHSLSTWTGGTFDHNTTKFPLTFAHKTVSCDRCHSDGVFTGRATTCVSCHQSDYNWSKSPPHAAGGLPTDCTLCHTLKSWKEGTFNHDRTAFPLTGAHRAALCASCHADAVYKGKPTACSSCHAPDFQKSLRPPHASLGFSTACATCHTTTAWTGAPYDHSKGAFPLTGAHRTVACNACHADGVYRGHASACVACHQKDYTASKTPPHVSGGFPTTCSQCHGTTSWQGSSFDHSTTAFPLTGGHKTVACTSCHGDGVYKGKSTACQSCHQATYAATAHPPHATLGFSTACATCHTTTAWTGGTFDHNTSAFPLTGAHRTVACNSCHANSVYRGHASNCAACHQANYAATSKPPHASSGYPTTCESCHGTAAWTGSAFDHATTRFPLVGAHKTASCTSCHGDGVYKGKSMLCVSCHQPAYAATSKPPHQTLGFSTVCSTCHGTVAWVPATFDHNTTAFPLAGAHRAAACNACHGDGVYKGKPTTCAGCHQAKYDATKTPAHAASGFPNTCQTCHTVTAWTPATYDHAATTFPLTGAHRTVPCTSCHGDGVYKGKNTACASCHQANYTASTRPPHASLGFSTTCQTCHTTTAWTGGAYDHNVTRFPLTGAHRAVACSGCHADGVYRGKTMLCVGCHLARYDASVNPPHKAAGFPTTCEVCHGTTAWTPATFNHSATLFPLTGAHVPLACSKCHGDGVYKGKSTLCVSCHQTTYNNTTNPNHRAANFPTACESCHTTTKWLGATFNHDGSYFPIYSGKHMGRWSACSDCHTVSTNYASFSCFACHRQTDMNDKHKSMKGYAYVSTVCYGCHPRGTKP